MRDKNELFSGTAPYYARYRSPYPKEIFEEIMNQYPFARNGSLLDLGCGTGEISIPLSGYFSKVFGLDINSEMLDEAELQAEKAGVQNIEWKLAAAEEMEKLSEPFDLITAGNSFHWMDRASVLHSSYNMMNERGGMVILAGGSVWNGKDEWQNKTVEVIQRYLGPERKAGRGKYGEPKRHEEYIAESSFRLLEQKDFVSVNLRTVEQIIGYLFSTSFSKAELFGERVTQFQEELTEELMSLNPQGVFQEKVETTCFFLKK